jgi:phage shock protein A
MATKAELETKIAALEAKLVIARETYHAHKAQIAELEAKLATRGCIATAAAKPVESKTWQWINRAGETCESTRTGNRTVTKVLA